MNPVFKVRNLDPLCTRISVFEKEFLEKGFLDKGSTFKDLLNILEAF